MPNNKKLIQPNIRKKLSKFKTINKTNKSNKNSKKMNKVWLRLSLHQLKIILEMMLNLILKVNKDFKLSSMKFIPKVKIKSNPFLSNPHFFSKIKMYFIFFTSKKILFTRQLCLYMKPLTWLIWIKLSSSVSLMKIFLNMALNNHLLSSAKMVKSKTVKLSSSDLPSSKSSTIKIKQSKFQV